MKLVSAFLLLLIGFVSYGNSLEERSYTVTDRDYCLGNIAIKLAVSQDSLEQWNGLSDPDKIKIGQQLKDYVVSTSSVSEDKLPKDGNSERNASEEHLDSSSTVKPSGDGEPPKEKDGSAFKTFLIVILISLSFAGAFFLFIKCFYRSKKHIFPAEPEKSPAIDIGGELLKLRNAIKQLNDQNVFLDKQHKALAEKIGKLEALLQQITDDIRHQKKDVYHIDYTKDMNKCQPSSHVIQTPPTEQTSPSVLYAKSIVDNCLCNVTSQPNGNTIFELHLNGANQAELCLYSGALKRIVANPAFIDGCDKQVINNDKNVEVRSTGLVRKDPISGRWQVIRKMDILIK